MNAEDLLPDERIYLRDILRAARYAALADAEGFHEVCYAIESLGMRLHGSEGTLYTYWTSVRGLAQHSPVFGELPNRYPELFTRFDALYETLRRARNDAMHSGSYARHAATAAVELCIGLEESLMNAAKAKTKVADYMVKTPVLIEDWQPVAHARHLMLMHSYSFIPYKHNHEWMLLSELAVVGFLQPLNRDNKAKALAKTIREAVSDGLVLLPAVKVFPSDSVAELVSRSNARPTPTLWLVVNDADCLKGVLSPFELM
ncbi:MAG: hypothetical protein RI918_2072 [Pseudomonadota bacterium]|jgi:hypothetical protein